MATCTELYNDTLGGLDLDGSTDKNLPYFVVENLANLHKSVAPLFGSPCIREASTDKQLYDSINMFN